MAMVITYGTYALFHVVHLRLLQRAKALAGDGGQWAFEGSIRGGFYAMEEDLFNKY